MRRDKRIFACKVKAFITESDRSHHRVAIGGCMTPQALCKICTARAVTQRGATEAQVIGIAVGTLCEEDELRLLWNLMGDRKTGASRALRRLLAFHQITPEQIALESCIGKRTVADFLAEALILTPDEAMRLFVAAVVRDTRRSKINALLECAGYYQLLPPLRPLSHAA